jgi:hypothetical protein
MKIFHAIMYSSEKIFDQQGYYFRSSFDTGFHSYNL